MASQGKVNFEPSKISQLIQKALSLNHSNDYMCASYDPIYPEEVRAIAELLQKMQEYNDGMEFAEKKNYAYSYALTMFNGLEKELKDYIADMEGQENSQSQSQARLYTFSLNCTDVICKNLKGVPRESSFWHFIVPLVNGFLKLIRVEPYKLHTTHFAKDSVINAGLNSVKDAGIAAQQITQMQAEHDNKDKPSP